MKFQIGDRVRVKDDYKGDGGPAFSGKEGKVACFYDASVRYVGVDFGVPRIGGYQLHDLNYCLKGRNEGWYVYARELEPVAPAFTAEELSSWDEYDMAE